MSATSLDKDCKKPGSEETLKVTDFTGLKEVKDCLADLEEHFREKGPMVISDVFDDEGNQYVNLVQKGGGVLGVALVGYTYVLEAMKIRFLRLAGTSAGAINTALMAVIKQRKDEKSEEIIQAICGLDFFELVDGHPVARWLIKKFITHTDFESQVKRVMLLVVGILAFLMAADITLLGLRTHYPFLSTATKAIFILTGIYLLLVGALLAFIASLLKRLKNSGFGINPGDFFYDWLKCQMEKNDVHSVDDLNKKAKQRPAGLRLRPGNPESLDDLPIDVTFITSELVTQNKIEFPLMYELFRLPTDKNQIHPAAFVRASMSIPIFFESYYIHDIQCQTQQIKDNWFKTFGEKDPPSKARFVDGGILSNFPINIFFNKNVDYPRVPSFGIDLDDTRKEETERDASAWSFPGFAGRLFNTVRFYYDKDFQIKNRVLQKGVGSIKLPEFNWLNFFLTKEEKQQMFIRGALAAAEFLKQFDWEAFKKERYDMKQAIS